MKYKLLTLLILSTVLTVACKEEDLNASSTTAKVTKNEAVAEVNGQYISKAAFDILKKEAQQRSKGQQIPADKLLDELIKMELLVQEATKEKLAKSPEIATRLAMVKRSILSQAAMQEYMKNNPVSDAELKAEYDKQIHAKGGTEFKARHILLKTEEDAKAVIAELDKGGDFIALAKSKSTGPSAAKGGDLGWFSPQRMVPPFSAAVVALENGKYTKTPVKTQFGWHVILREDSRDKTPPPFEAVKKQLRPYMQRQKLQNHLATLRSQAKVEIFMPLKTAAPAKAVPETPVKATPVKAAPTAKQTTTAASQPAQEPKAAQ